MMSDRTRPRPLPDPPPARGFGKLPVGRWFLLASSAVALMFAIAAAVTVVAIGAAREAKTVVVDVVDPAALRTLELSGAVSTQESAVRAYGRTGEAQHLRDYRAAVEKETAALDAIGELLPRMPEPGVIRAELDAIRQATTAWRREYGDAVMDAAKPGRSEEILTEDAKSGSEHYAGVRASLTALEDHLTRAHTAAGARLDQSWQSVYAAVGGVATVLVLAFVGFAVIVRYAVLRPVAELTGQVRAVAQGAFDHRLRVERPAELAELSGHVDAMRRRILAEWHRASEAQARLEEQAVELRRSNGELEQFAYVASHDLQEPLRKVASFTQMLEQRYGDQLDDRAKQYIAFSVDGAKRMQSLISDLLDFSRVGRLGGERSPIDSAIPLKEALDNLSAPIEETGATVTFDEMPVVYGNRQQLTQLFQNLIGNAVKFRSRQPPVVHIGARPAGDMWEFSCSDNGIGIESKYTDRIFLIFQRLHGRDVYPGTGIGLALCKKIVEYHGGEIWVDAKDSDNGHDSGASRQKDAKDVKQLESGTTFRWTLPRGDTDE
ncbi:histidine kinase [Planobispora rosea]|uniref:histidine kinase n=1 Tax=Planobispora rosea TaxID=35762 RepID=A0A8J3WDA4_PLARO|nr:ATP-binding protein [Planobispora rosea]GGS65643.1 histidine kinase [Planobispora rosea]GIH84933.1 histidine kinase [Planobispora rosea]